MSRFATIAKTAAATAAAAFITTAAQAERFFTTEVGNWTIGAFANDESGRFTHCGASVTYKSGIELLFSIERDFSWMMGFASSDWNLTPGQAYQVRYQIDKGHIYSGQAFATNPNLARVDLPVDSDLFTRMRRGSTLFVETPNDVLSFSLTSTNRLLTTLLDCVEKYEAYVHGPQSKDPFGSGAVSFDEADLRSEAHYLAKAMMSELNVDFHYIAPSENPALYETYDSIWEMGQFVGSMRIVDIEDLGQIDGYLAESEAEDCEGEFHTKIKPGDDNSQFIRRIAVCSEANGKDVINAYMTYQRPQGGTYILQIFTTSASFEDTLKVGDVLTDVAWSLVAGT